LKTYNRKYWKMKNFRIFASGKHKIKRKAEQMACEETLKYLD